MSNGFYYLYAERETFIPHRDESRNDFSYNREMLAVFTSQKKVDAYIESSKVQHDEFWYEWKISSVLFGCRTNSQEVVFVPLDLEPCA